MNRSISRPSDHDLMSIKMQETLVLMGASRVSFISKEAYHFFSSLRVSLGGFLNSNDCVAFMIKSLD